jgi:hypothetical protein
MRISLGEIALQKLCSQGCSTIISLSHISKYIIIRFPKVILETSWHGHGDINQKLELRAQNGIVLSDQVDLVIDTCSHSNFLLLSGCIRNMQGLSMT